MRLIDADFIISILDEAEQEHPEHKFSGVGEHGAEKRVRGRRIHGC